MPTASPASDHSVAEQLALLDPEERVRLLNGLTDREKMELLYNWEVWARPKQKMPEGDWFGWLRLAGRGEGKTRTGAETVRIWAGKPADPPVRIALVAETAADARDVLIQGESGLLNICPPWNMPVYQPSKRRLVWPNGTIGITFSGEEPDQLRGPQFHYAWVDELAKYQKPQLTWDNLEFGLRLGERPRVVITTTPRPIDIIRRLLLDPNIRVTTGSSYENIANLAPSFIERVIERYEGTRVGRQEIHAEVLEDTPGALWTYRILEQCRERITPPLRRVVVAIDPAVTSNEDTSDETGIVVAGLGSDGHGYVLADKSGVYTPAEWANEALRLFRLYHADRIIGEQNNGGEMVEYTLRSVEPRIPYKKVNASHGKTRRAEPVAAEYERGKVHHVGVFKEMEDQMVATTAEEYLGGGSPDRMDAAVWALTELMLKFYRRPMIQPTISRRSFGK